MLDNQLRMKKLDFKPTFTKIVIEKKADEVTILALDESNMFMTCDVKRLCKG